MPLTPADVHNVAFSKPPIGKRGYNEDEVDQFLDLVEDTLAELQDENADLQRKVEEGSGAGTAAAAAPAVDEAELRRKIEADVRRDVEADVRREVEAKVRKDVEAEYASRAPQQNAASNSEVEAKVRR